MKNLRSIMSAMALTCLAFVSTAQKAADYAGEYTMSDNPYVKVLKLADKEGKLIMSAEGFPDTELTPGSKPDAFVLGGMGGDISFTRVGGAVTKLKIEAQGQTLEGVKAGAAVASAAASGGIADYAATFKMALASACNTIHLVSPFSFSQQLSNPVGAPLNPSEIIILPFTIKAPTCFRLQWDNFPHSKAMLM